MSIVITGATGNLGRHVIQVLLERNVPVAEIVAAGRSLEKIKPGSTDEARRWRRAVNVQMPSEQGRCVLRRTTSTRTRGHLTSASIS